MLNVPKYRLADLERRVASVNRKAVKLGMPEVTFTVGREYEANRRIIVGVNDEGQAVEQAITLTMVEVEIQGDLPRLGGWLMHSRVEPVEPGVNFVFTHSAFAPVEALRSTPMICQHCNHNRQRSRVYVVQHAETGEQKIVGHTCMKDFLPGTNVEAAMQHMENLFRLQNTDSEWDEGDNIPREAWNYSMRLAIAEALVLVRRDGFVSKKDAQASWDRGEPKVATMEFLGRTGITRHKFYTDAELAAVADDVQKVIDYVQSLNGAASDFVYNSQVMMRLENITYKMFSFVAANVMMYEKSLHPDTPITSNMYVGQIGEKTTVNVRVLQVTAWTGAHGPMYTHVMEDENGNQITFFANKRKFAEGHQTKLTGTVKSHREYKGRKQTIINYVKEEK